MTGTLLTRTCRGRECDMWLALGSYWGGIKMRSWIRKPGSYARDTTLSSLASRQTRLSHCDEDHSLSDVEKYYYLFVCSTSAAEAGTAHIRYGGALNKINGPIFDSEGKPLMAGGHAVDGRKATPGRARRSIRPARLRL